MLDALVKLQTLNIRPTCRRRAFLLSSCTSHIDGDLTDVTFSHSGIMFIPLVLCWLALVSISQQQKDPLKDFCRIFGHSTTLVDHKLYIDGGLVNWSPLSASSLNYSSQFQVPKELTAFLY